MTGPYDDMLNLPHPTSRRHPRMSSRTVPPSLPLLRL